MKGEPGRWRGYGIVVRHGITEWDSAARGPRIEGGQQPFEGITGWLDLPLRRDSDATTESLRGLSHQPIDIIATSTLQRALVTARMIHRLHPLAALRPLEELRAWNTGVYSGQLASTAQAGLDYAVSHPDAHIPMGETFRAFLRRFLPVALCLLDDSQLVCIVTHGMNVEVLLKHRLTGGLSFDTYTGVHGELGPGGALWLTPDGVVADGQRVLQEVL